MNFVDVYFHGLERAKPLLLGRLAYEPQVRCAQFEMDPDFLRCGINPSPLQLKRRPGLQPAKVDPFNGLHGLFADSLPDSWGQWLMDKAFRRLGLDLDRVTPIDRLAFIGSRAMGALSYVPDRGDRTIIGERLLDLAEMGREATRQYQGSAARLLDELVRNASPSGGARPKILVGLNDDGKQAVAGAEDLPEGYRHWLAKFPVGDAPEQKAAGMIEYLFAQMAAQAGVRMMPTRLVPGRKGHAYFITERFDRLSGNRRRHVHTVAGLVGADHKVPSFDYLDLLKLSEFLTESHEEKVETFRRMVFNLVSGNRDDHTKNFAFMLSPDGEWSQTPAYDITFNVGIGMPVQGKNHGVSLDDLLNLAHATSIPRSVAVDVITQVCDAMSLWAVESKQYSIPPDMRMTIEGNIERRRKRMQPVQSAPPP